MFVSFYNFFLVSGLSSFVVVRSHTRADSLFRNYSFMALHVSPFSLYVSCFLPTQFSNKTTNSRGRALFSFIHSGMLSLLIISCVKCFSLFGLSICVCMWTMNTQHHCACVPLSHILSQFVVSCVVSGFIRRPELLRFFFRYSQYGFFFHI